MSNSDETPALDDQALFQIEAFLRSQDQAYIQIIKLDDIITSPDASPAEKTARVEQTLSTLMARSE